MSSPLPRNSEGLRRILSIGIIAIILWSIIPGIGPDLLQLEARTGLKISIGNSTSTPADPQLRAALDKLRLRDRDSESPRKYSRKEFGEAWYDADGNGCDTRNDVLRRDLQDVKTVPGTQKCKVASGTLHGPYSGKIIAFIRGPKTSPLVQIDHVVALGDAWRSGAERWDPIRRQNFANDPLNLLATDGPTNEDKASAAADTWLPPQRSYRCAYVARQIAVKAKWDLSVTLREKQALLRVLSKCETLIWPRDAGGVSP